MDGLAVMEDGDMKLIDLEPVWLSPDMFAFKNPTGGKYWLTCKRVIMPRRQQAELCYTNPEIQHAEGCVVLTEPDYAWNFSGNDFNALTVMPSIDASASGNWHGFITDGVIR